LYSKEDKNKLLYSTIFSKTCDNLRFKEKREGNRTIKDNDTSSIVTWKWRFEMEEEMQALTVRWN
jgi:hypothetical protein